MKIKVTVKVTSEQLSVLLPDWDVSRRVPCLVAYNPHQQKILAVGKARDELMQIAPKEWAQIQADVQVVNPFDINRFDPVLAERMLSYLAVEQRNIRRSDDFVDTIKFMFIDRFDYTMAWPDYDLLAEEDRISFEEGMRTFGRVHKLTINGKQRGWPRRQLRLASWSLFFSTILWLLAPLFVVLPWMKDIHAPALVTPVIVIAWLLIGNMFAEASWLLVFRNSLPAPIIRSILFRQKGFRKTTEWLFANLIG